MTESVINQVKSDITAQSVVEHIESEGIITQTKSTSLSLARLKIYAWFVCALAAVFYFYEFLLRIEPSVMQQALQAHLGVGALGLGFIFFTYYIAYAPLQAIVGIVTDYHGPKWVLTFAVLFCALGCVVFGLTHHLDVAAIGRFMVGVGSAFAFVGVLKLAAMWLPRRQFALFVGVTTALGMLGAMFGDWFMTWAVTHYGWRHVIWGSAIFGCVLVPIFAIFVYEKRHIHTTSSSAAKLLGSESHRPAEGTLNKSLRHSLTGLWQIIKNRQIVLAGLMGCMLYLSLSAFAESWGISFVERVSDVSHMQAAMINSMVFLGWLVGAPLNGWLSDRFRSRRWLLMGGALLAALVFSVVLIVPHFHRWILGGLLFLFGVFASAEVISFAVARDNVSVKFTATAMGVVNLLVMLSGIVLQPIVPWVLHLAWHGTRHLGVPVYTTQDYRLALVVIPVAMLLAAVMGFFLKESYPTSSHSRWT